MINARRAKDANWSNDAWDGILKLFQTGDANLHPETVNDYDEDEWADDKGSRKVGGDEESLTLVDV